MSPNIRDIGDRYTITAPIGRGGMARVFLVRHAKLGSLHALKVLEAADPSIHERFLQEGRIQSTLRHPNIVSVTDLIEVDGFPALVMDYIDGPTLDELIERRSLDLDQVDQLVRGIIAGVAEAHRHGLIHRDLKPSNILLDIQGDALVPRVVDFGIAKVLGGAQSSGPATTRTGMALGTPAYMAPEQVRDTKSVTTRADIFALGAILYELVTRRRAF
jgi:serine/threonine-protein kinase